MEGLTGTAFNCVSSHKDLEIFDDNITLGTLQPPNLGQGLNETFIYEGSDEYESEPDLMECNNETIIDAESDSDECAPDLFDGHNDTIIDVQSESDIDVSGFDESEPDLHLYLSDSDLGLGNSEAKDDEIALTDNSCRPAYKQAMCEVDDGPRTHMFDLSAESHNLGLTTFSVDVDPVIDRDIDHQSEWNLYLSDSEQSEEESNQQEFVTKAAVCHKRKFAEMGTLDLGAKFLEKCCDSNCMSKLSISDLCVCQEHMLNKSEAKQKQFILTEISKHTLMSISASRHCSKPTSQHRFIIGGKYVCVNAWCIAYSVSNWRFKECLKLHEAGRVKVHHGNMGKRKKCEKTKVALAWMTDLFKRLGDYMPHRSVVNLPHTWTKKEVYERMRLELKERNEINVGTISYEHFTRIWLEHLPQFVIPTSTDFTKCTTCTQLQEAYEKAPSNSQRKTIADLKAAHDQYVEAERKAYHQARERSRREPDEMTCVIIDGMDQSKTGVPHLIVKDKDSANLARLPVHFTGVLVHTATPEGKVPFVFSDIKHIPHDSNLTIHCLTEALRMSQCRLGKVLFLQMDNCYRENKNKFVLSYAALLVEKDIFKEVYIHFLPVGHTHEDIDQMFSCVARHLRHTNTYTLEDLETETSKSFTPHINMNRVTAIQDAKSEINKHIYGTFGNHSKPHWFRFRKTNQRCYMHYKKWESDLWKPEESEEYPNGLLCLKDVPDLKNSLEWVSPCLDKIDLPKLMKELPALYSHRMSPAAQEWWKCFLDCISSTYEELPATQQWNCAHLVHNVSEFGLPLPACNTTMEEIANALEADCPDVYIGNQGKAHGRVLEMDGYCSVECGVLAVVHCEEKKGRPFIGEVIKKDGENVLVSWLRGSWTGQWQPWVQGSSGKKGPYTSLVPVTSLILWDFQLSRKKKLKKSTVETLKAMYSNLDKESSK